MVGVFHIARQQGVFVVADQIQRPRLHAPIGEGRGRNRQRAEQTLLDGGLEPRLDQLHLGQQTETQFAVGQLVDFRTWDVGVGQQTVAGLARGLHHLRHLRQQAVRRFAQRDAKRKAQGAHYCCCGF